jgi:hypothetical protein
MPGGIFRRTSRWIAEKTRHCLRQYPRPADLCKAVYEGYKGEPLNPTQECLGDARTLTSHRVFASSVGLGRIFRGLFAVVLALFPGGTPS